MNDDSVVICSYARTPIGGMLGSLSTVKATELGAIAVRAAVERSSAAPDAIERIYMGCVLPAGLGQAPARQAALAAGLPRSVEATTVNKMCGSGMQAILLACDSLQAGSADLVIAGGMESMSQAPYLLDRHRRGARMGHHTIQDSMFVDGLEDAYEEGVAMGVFADRSAKAHGITRDEQDHYALTSLARAQAAIESGAFAREIIAVTVPGRGGSTEVHTDEQPTTARPDKVPHLKPAFSPDGTVTAANASSISDGAAALLLTCQQSALTMGLPIRARVVAQATHAQDPEQFTSAPIPAIQKVLDRAGWYIADVDLFEINEAFAVVPLLAMRELHIAEDRLNVHGGATALGHPIGASGARIVVTLIAALQKRGGTRGVAAVCIGGGEATAIAIELVHRITLTPGQHR